MFGSLTRILNGLALIAAVSATPAQAYLGETPSPGETVLPNRVATYVCSSPGAVDEIYAIAAMAQKANDGELVSRALDELGCIKVFTNMHMTVVDKIGDEYVKLLFKQYGDHYVRYWGRAISWSKAVCSKGEIGC